MPSQALAILEVLVGVGQASFVVGVNRIMQAGMRVTESAIRPPST